MAADDNKLGNYYLVRRGQISVLGTQGIAV